MRNLVLHNWPLKLLSLLLAFLLWATYTAEPASEVGFQVPLEFTHVPEKLEVASDVPAQVYVRVRGRSALLRRLSAHDFAIQVDLSGSAAGESQLQLTLDKVDAPPGVTVVRVSPSQFRLRLDARQ